MPVDQAVALRAQLGAIAGNEPTSSFLEIRPLTPDGRPAIRDRAFVPVRDLSVATDRILELAARTHVYVGAAPRVREDGTGAAVARIWSLWADLDGADALERLAAFRPLPSIVIRTGSDGCAHAYWPLRDPVPPRWGVRYNRRIAAALGADIAATDAARILRPAGTLNHKHRPPRPVVCTRLELDVFTGDRVAGHLPDDPAFIAPRQIDPSIARDPESMLAALGRVVASAAPGNRNRALYWAACRLREHAETGRVDLAAGRATLHDSAIAAGLAEQETLAALRSALDRMAVAA